MGLAIVIIVGAVLGWLAAIVVDRDDRVGTAICAFVGAKGALVAALLAGDVPLVRGLSEEQLLWSVLGALLAIVAVNAIVVQRFPGNKGSV
ncbi:GlsB/YeaQ/YmgE family stress response membrane protein [Qipengyuania sediminis]|uniref:GlsB/YeaQ/YmgE family stress response membrane protein n=1 Tax=Qipengyuania sediminis TaxID=1532023 RepID=UPI0010592D15|nr:GlsB/YeaQ/YmgE family stress response membrane protein [Qipengyuania sediminis]